MAFWSTRAHPSLGTPPPPYYAKTSSLYHSPTSEPPLQLVSPYHIPLPSIVPRYPFQSRPTPPDGAKGMCLFSRLVIALLFPTLESTHLLPIRYSHQALSPATLLSTGVNPQLCPFLEGPQSQIPQISQNSSPSATPKSLIAVPFSYAKPCHPTTPPLLKPPPPQHTHPKLFPGALPHQDRLSQPPPPTRVRAGAGPTGGWGAVGPPVGWASSQHGGGGGGEETAACPGPAGSGKPYGREGKRDRRPVGDNSSRRGGRGRGGDRDEGQPGAHREGKGRWTGEGRVNPRPAGPAPRSHRPPGTQASGLPFWRAARASGQA